MIVEQLLALLGALAVFQVGVLGLERFLEGLRAPAAARARVLRTANGCVLLAIPAYLVARGFLTPVPQVQLASTLGLAGGAPGVGVTDSLRAFSWSPWALGVTAAVSGILLGRLCWRYWSTSRALSGGRVGFVLGRPVRFVRGLHAPLSFGLRRGRIFVPDDFSALSAREAELALVHEEIHIRGGDLRAKVASLAVRALLWFHPFAYALHARLELVLELACDDATMGQAASSPREYGSLLLKFGVGTGSFDSITASMRGASLTRRVYAMTRTTVQRPALTVFSMVSLVLGACVAVASAGGALENRDQFKISAKVFVDGRHISSPTIVTVEGEEASISQVREDGTDALHMEVVARNEPGAAPGAIRLEMRVRSERDGRVVDSRPMLVLAENREGTIEVGSQDGPAFAMKVSVDRLEKVKN